MHTKWTGSRADRALVPHVIKRDLTPALRKNIFWLRLKQPDKLTSGSDRLNPVIAEEVDLAFREELPPCKDFTPVNINQKLLRIVAKVSGRIFVGPELCRSEDYIDMAINYTLELMGAQQAISLMKHWQRLLFGNSAPQVKALHKRKAKAKEFLRPVIIARKTAAKEDPDFQKPDDILQWILDDGQAKFGDQEDEELADIQLNLTFAAIHTTTMTTTNSYVHAPNWSTLAGRGLCLHFLDSTPLLPVPSSSLSCARRSVPYSRNTAPSPPTPCKR